MTVCLAALFRWNYATASKPDADWGVAGLALSDRMITSGNGDIEYEPSQQKVCYLTSHIVLLIAGDYPTHSQALKVVQAQLKGRIGATPYDAAVMYGVAIQALQRKLAEDLYLAPLGLNTDSFIAQQKDMAPHFVDNITNQLQSFKGEDVAALILGMSNNIQHLYEVDRNGSVRCHDDVGFAAIGIGASHVNAVMTQAGYSNIWWYAPTLSIAFAAKKAAETAPGVGKATDIHLIFRSGTERLRQDVADKLPEIYTAYTDARRTLAFSAMNQLQEAINATAPGQKEKPAPAASEGDSGPPGSGATEGPEDAAKGAE